MMQLYLKWIVLYALAVTVLTKSNGSEMEFIVNDSKSLTDAFDLMTTCFMSANHQSNLNDSTNTTGDLICCKSHSVCYNSINIIFMSGIHTLKENYTITNLQNIRFSSSVSGTPPTIKCITENNDFDANAGLTFVQVRNLTIEHLNIMGCGIKHTSTSTSKYGEFITHLSALYIQNSTDLSVSNVNISSSKGTGLSIIDTNGTINIINSFFGSNRIIIPAELSSTITGGGGIYIEFTECAPGVSGCNSSGYLFANNSVIHVENCVFEQNRAWYNFSGSLTASLDTRTYIGFGAGGGLSLQFNGDVMDIFISVTVVSSNFSYNEANNGGGLSLYGRYNTSYIHLNISGCTFLNNSATYFGGGGIVVGFVIFNALEKITHNTIIIDGCSFKHNESPVVGGGLSWHGGTELLGTQQTNYFSVSRSSFLYNRALYGSAIQINKEYFDLIDNGTFMNLRIDSCNFTYNSANILLTTSAPSGVGVVSASRVNIQFSGYTDFSSNNSTALVGDAAELGFHNHSVTIFKDNRGFLGGAILLMSSSVINVHFNSTVVFRSNIAVINGGAIYVHFATLFDYLISYSCFIKYLGENIPIDEWNTNFIFIDNKAADNQSNSIFTTTLRPCQNTYSKGFLNKHPFCFYSSTTKESSPPINMNANLLYIYNKQHCLNSTQDQISTSSTKFCNVSNNSIYVVPGKVYDLNVCIIDELDNWVTGAQFVATCANTCSDTCTDSSYASSESLSNMPRVLPAYRTNNGSIQIAGPPGSTCQLQLQTIADFQITGTWLVKLLNCPPGFIHSSEDEVCTCLTSREHQNPVILGCEQTSFQAYFNQFYWIGYRSDDAADLLVGSCPYQYCYENSVSGNNALLPAVANKTALDSFVCGNSSRTGTLCGQCIDGYSVTLNSPTFTCDKCDDEYKLGVLYLLLSYIIPVSILFLIIMTFDIRITTGPIGAFIFFAQIMSSEFHYILIYNINANRPATRNTFNAILGIYSIANLDFFNHDVFKYCIFQRAGTIDIVAFELLLSLYPVLLITTYALFRKYYYICKWPRCFRRFSFSSKSITHGICAFLVICFAKINLQAFTILIPAEISYIDEIDRSYKTLVYLQGNLEYFKEMPHTLYALGSILFIILVIAIPTLILMLHPIMMKVVIYFQWGESKVVLLINKCLMIHRLKPVLDSFQGNYKDNLQFFAGLQIFFYRTIFFLIVVVTTPDIDKSLLFITGYFVAIILIHNLVMPFKRYVDNAVYSIIYMLMLTIIIIELYTIISGVFLEGVIWLQIILCLLPLFCFVFYYTWKLIKYVRKFYQNRFQADEIRGVS